MPPLLDGVQRLQGTHEDIARHLLGGVAATGPRGDIADDSVVVVLVQLGEGLVVKPGQVTAGEGQLGALLSRRGVRGRAKPVYHSLVATSGTSQSFPLLTTVSS